LVINKNYKRKCSSKICNNTWECTGICDESAVLQEKDFCWCYDCLKSNRHDSIEGMVSWRNCNRNNLDSISKIIDNCYKSISNEIIAKEL